MTVQELIDELSKYPYEYKVMTPDELDIQLEVFYNEKIIYIRDTNYFLSEDEED